MITFLAFLTGCFCGCIAGYLFGTSRDEARIAKAITEASKPLQEHWARMQEGDS